MKINDAKINKMYGIAIYNFTHKTYLIVAFSLRVILRILTIRSFKILIVKFVCNYTVQLFGLCVIPFSQNIAFIVALYSTIQLISSNRSISFKFFLPSIL